jgi:hypothetical protein
LRHPYRRPPGATGVSRKRFSKENKVVKKPSAKVVIVSIVIIVFFLMHFNTIWYRGQRILVFHLDFIKNLRTGNQYGVILGTYTLESEFGSITVKPFSRFRSASYRLSTIESTSLGKIDYDLVILGNKITPYSWVGFSVADIHHKLDIYSIMIDGNLPVSPYLFKVRDISIKREDVIAERDALGHINSLRDIETHEIWLKIYDYPEIIELADGTEIRFPVKGGGGSYWFIVQKTDTWIIRGRGYVDEGDNISVKLPGEKEFRAYETVSFEKDWGRFIEGTPFKVQEEPRFSDEDLLLMERFGLKEIYDEYLKDGEE